MIDKATLTPEVEAALRLRPPVRPNKYAEPADVMPMEATFPPMEGLPARVPLADGLILRNGSELESKPVTWLWKHWLAAGKLQLLAGAPGQGKTTIAMAMAATVTIGGHWPDGSRCEVGNIIVWSGEDDPADTLLPRLLASGADRRRCYFIEGARRDGEVEPFDPARDLPMLHAAIEQIGNVKLLIVDPVVSAVTGDSHKNTEVRRALQPLVDMGAACGCAILGITHFSKGGQGSDPAQRIIGSVAFAAVARVVLVAAKVKGEDGEDARILARSKSNIGPDDGGFHYHLEQAEPIPGIQASYITWGKAVEGSARELLTDPDASGEDQSEANDAVSLLRAELSGCGWVNSETASKPLKDAGFSKKQIWSASKKLSIDRKKDGMSGCWLWRLPANYEDSGPEDSHEGSKGSKNGDWESSESSVESSGVESSVAKDGDVAEFVL